MTYKEFLFFEYIFSSQKIFGEIQKLQKDKHTPLFSQFSGIQAQMIITLKPLVRSQWYWEIDFKSALSQQLRQLPEMNLDLILG